MLEVSYSDFYQEELKSIAENAMFLKQDELESVIGSVRNDDPDSLIDVDHPIVSGKIFDVYSGALEIFEEVPAIGPELLMEITYQKTVLLLKRARELQEPSGYDDVELPTDDEARALLKEGAQECDRFFDRFQNIAMNARSDLFTQNYLKAKEKMMDPVKN